MKYHETGVFSHTTNRITRLPPELAKIADETGYDFFSMRQIYMGLPEEPDFDLSKNKKLLSETKAVMANTGIRLLDIELARNRF